MGNSNIEICIQNEFITTSYHKDLDIIVEEWHGFAPSDGFRQVSDDLIGLIQKKKCGKVLNNFIGGKVIHPEDQKWINDDWFPRAIAGGLTHFAFLLSEDFFNQRTVKSIMKNVDFPDLQYYYFKDYKEAQDWLVSLEMNVDKYSMP